MIKQKELVANPAFNPHLPVSWDGLGPGGLNRPNLWKYGDANRNLRVNDIVEFLCNGRGRGGHVRVFAKVTKVNRKTFKALELPRSYSPGTNWTVNIAYALEPGNGGITIDLSWKE
jgi:hypothetical protein